MAYDAAKPPGADQTGFRDHIHACWFLRRGGVTVDHADGRLRAGPGGWILIPAGARRTQRFSADAALLSVRFTAERSDGIPLAAGPPRQLAAAAEPGLLPAAEAVVAAAHPGDLAGACRQAAALAAFLAAWLAAWGRLGGGAVEADAADPRLARALGVLERHGRLAPAPWTAIRAATGWSRSQCDRAFLARIGCTPAAWLDRRQRQRAEEALAEPGVAIKAVARRLGFRDASHFVRWYRRGAGVPPGRARRLA